MHTRFLSFVFGTLFMFTFCKHEPAIRPGTTSDNNNNAGNAENPCNPDSVYFENDIMPILRSNCSMKDCHGNGSAKEGVDLTTYNSIMNTADVRPGNPNGSDLYEVLLEEDAEKRMPQPPVAPLSAEQIAMIRKWIQQGAKNNICNSCDTNQVSYANTLAPIFAKNCNGCHNDNLANGNVKLHNYDQVKIVAQNGKLVGSITHATGYTPMPQSYPPGSVKLPDCTINKIKIWVAAGAPNN
ncbi:MAG: c-type cytochrome domain-containing protein [Bacteroidia bacterium]